MDSRSDTVESLVAAAVAPRRDGWDLLLIAAIFASIGALAYAALATQLLQRVTQSAQAVTRRVQQSLIVLGWGWLRRTKGIDRSPAP